MPFFQTTVSRPLKLISGFFIVAFTLASFQSPITGQEQDRPIIEEIKELYNQFRYDEVIVLCQKALAADPPPTEQEQVDTYTHLAFAYIAIGNSEEAKGAFRSALDLRPNLSLDPIYVSPKIIAIFNEVKTEKEREQEDIGIQPRESELISNVARMNMKRGGAWRSLILPGWGQRYKGHKRKAIVFFAAHTINVGTLLYAHLQMNRAHDDYLKAREPSTIESKYDKYNSFYKLRNYCLLSTAAVWLYSHIDAAITSPASHAEGPNNERTHLITPIMTSTSIGLAYTIQF